jgi:phospho-N-acetylmuramoyl-pentapeptide-transferase
VIDRLVLAAALAAALMLAIGRWGIPVLRWRNVQQRIRDEAPSQHHGKAGTPTMGGLLLVPSAAVAAVLVAPQLGWALLLPLAVMLGYGAVGAVDDALAIRYRRNLGLRARERLVLQGALAAGVAIVVLRRPELAAGMTLPGLGVIPPWVYGVFVVLYVVAFTNAVNLADGLDGLAAGTVALAAAAYAAIAASVGRSEVAVLAAAIAGACAGFLWFNAHPALVFMGDVGSNALGAVLAAIAIVTKTEWLLLVVGVVFVAEAVSVVVQVAYFKATGGRRIFRMSPLHHHFELAGWSETQTVTRFWLVGAAAALVGVALIH